MILFHTTIFFLMKKEMRQTHSLKIVIITESMTKLSIKENNQ